MEKPAAARLLVCVWGRSAKRPEDDAAGEVILEEATVKLVPITQLRTPQRQSGAWPIAAANTAKWHTEWDPTWPTSLRARTCNLDAELRVSAPLALF